MCAHSQDHGGPCDPKWPVCVLIAQKLNCVYPYHALPSINAYVLFIEFRMFFTGKTDTGMLTGFIPAVGLDRCDVKNKPVLIDYKKNGTGLDVAWVCVFVVSVENTFFFFFSVAVVLG